MPNVASERNLIVLPKKRGDAMSKRDMATMPDPVVGMIVMDMGGMGTAVTTGEALETAEMDLDLLSLLGLAVPPFLWDQGVCKVETVADFLTTDLRKVLPVTCLPHLLLVLPLLDLPLLQLRETLFPLLRQNLKLSVLAISERGQMGRSRV